MRTGLPWSTATLQIVANCSSRRLPVPTLPGLIRYLSSAARAVRVARQQQVPVVVEVADERRRAAGVEHPLLDLGHRGRGLGHVDRDAHHLRSGFPQLDDLPRRRRRVGGVGHRHRLDDDGRAAADLDAADLHADGLVEPCLHIASILIPRVNTPPPILETRREAVRQTAGEPSSVRVRSSSRSARFATMRG